MTRPLTLYVIRWRGPAGGTWVNERYARSPQEALAAFRQDTGDIRGITVLGISTPSGSYWALTCNNT